MSNEQHAVWIKQWNKYLSKFADLNDEQRYHALDRCLCDAQYMAVLAKEGTLSLPELVKEMRIFTTVVFELFRPQLEAAQASDEQGKLGGEARKWAAHHVNGYKDYK